MKEAQNRAFFLAKMTVCEEKCYYYRKSKHFYTKNDLKLAKVLAVSCYAFSKALNQQRVSVDTDIGKILAR